MHSGRGRAQLSSFPGKVQLRGFCSAKEPFGMQLNVFTPACGASRPWLMHPEWLTTLERTVIHPTPLHSAHSHCSKEEVMPSFSFSPAPCASGLPLFSLPGARKSPLSLFALFFPFFPPEAPCSCGAAISPRLPYPVPLRTDGRPQFPLTSKGIRTDKTGRNRPNSSWQDINLEISGVVAPAHDEFESELSRCQRRQRFDREGNWRKWLCNPAIVLARSSSPQEQGSLPGMADSAAFICPWFLLAFPCLAETLQSSARGVLGIQAFSSLGRGRNGVVKAAGSIPSGVQVLGRSRTQD